MFGSSFVALTAELLIGRNSTRPLLAQLGCRSAVMFCPSHVLRDHAGCFLGMSRNHEMSRSCNGGNSGVRYALSQKFVRAFHARMADLAPQHKGWDVNSRKQRGRQLETIGACPVRKVDRRGLTGVIANAKRPAGERARATIEVDHLFDRSRFASLEGSEIGLAHLAEREIVPVLAHVPQNFWRRG